MQKIHVVLKKEELDPARLGGKVVIVLDILFATSTIVSAFAHGVARVLPAVDAAAALATARARPDEDIVLAGELNAERLDGFRAPTPLALLREDLRGKTLVYSTTNGTVALARSARAAHVYAGALLNGPALVRHIVARHPEDTVLIVCSGSIDRFNLEDFYGAGYFVAQFAAAGARQFTDAALAARLLYAGSDARACLGAARVGRRMLAKGLDAELDHAASIGRFDCVPVLRGEALVIAD